MKVYAEVMGLLYALLRHATAPAAAPASGLAIQCLPALKQHLVGVIITLEAFVRTAAGAAANGQPGNSNSRGVSPSAPNRLLTLGLLNHATAVSLDELSELFLDSRQDPLFSLAFSSSSNRSRSGSSILSVDPQSSEQKHMCSLLNSMQKLSNTLAVVFEGQNMDAIMRALALQQAGVDTLPLAVKFAEAVYHEALYPMTHSFQLTPCSQLSPEEPGSGRAASGSSTGNGGSSGTVVSTGVCCPAAERGAGGALLPVLGAGAGRT